MTDKIKSVTALQTSTDLKVPGVKVTVVTEEGFKGCGTAFEKYSESPFAPAYLYDGEAAYDGKSVNRAVELVETVIAPAIIGMDVTDQPAVDAAIMAAARAAGIGPAVNVTGPVSIAVLHAAAASTRLPLYRYVGGRSACTLPVGGYRAASGSMRYGMRGLAQVRPIYNIVSYGFDSFAEAHYALWEVANLYEKLLAKNHHILTHRGMSLDVPPKKVESDLQLLDIMKQSIDALGFTDRMGIHIDVGASQYFQADNGTYAGIFDTTPRTTEDLLAYYLQICADYPIVMLQDPFHWSDRASHKALVEASGVEIVGQDLFACDVAEIKRAIDEGVVNSVALTVCGFETFSDAVEVVRYARAAECGILPMNECGEGFDVAHYAVGFRAGCIYQCGCDATVNPVLAIEEDIAVHPHFYGKSGFTGKAFELYQEN